MKKLRKVKTNLQDSIEAYEGICDCMIGCNCVICSCQEIYLDAMESLSPPSYSNLESTSLSISLSHYKWA